MTADTSDDEDSQWRYSLADLEESTEETDEDGDKSVNITGSLQIDDELEPGEINTEHALFVVAGVVVAVACLLGFVTLLF
jgi:hypothetical protein